MNSKITCGKCKKSKYEHQIIIKPNELAGTYAECSTCHREAQQLVTDKTRSGKMPKYTKLSNSRVIEPKPLRMMYKCIDCERVLSADNFKVANKGHSRYKSCRECVTTKSYKTKIVNSGNRRPRACTRTNTIQCTQCGERKDIDEYHKRRMDPVFGRTRTCITCVNVNRP